MTDEEIAFAIREYALRSLVHACAKKTLSGAYLGIAEAEFNRALAALAARTQD